MYQPLAISGKPYALVEQKPADKFEIYKKQLKPVIEWKKHQADFQGRGMEIKQYKFIVYKAVAGSSTSLGMWLEDPLSKMVSLI